MDASQVINVGLLGGAALHELLNPALHESPHNCRKYYGKNVDVLHYKPGSRDGKDTFEKELSSSSSYFLLKNLGT